MSNISHSTAAPAAAAAPSPVHSLSPPIGAGAAAASSVPAPSSFPIQPTGAPLTDGATASSASALHSTATMMEDEAPSASASASASAPRPSAADGASPAAATPAAMSDSAPPASPALELLHSHTQPMDALDEALAQPSAVAAAAAASGSSRKRAFDDEDEETASSDQPSSFAVDNADQPLSSDHLSKKARASQREGAVPSAAAASSSSFHSAEAASMAPDSMAEEPVSSAASAAAASSSSFDSPALPVPFIASTPSNDESKEDADEDDLSIELFESALSLDVSGPWRPPPPLRRRLSEEKVDEESTWRELCKQLRRAREDNDADRSALLMESGRLNELKNCFQLSNEQLGLPFLPSVLLPIIADYAGRIPDDRPAVLAVLLTFYRLGFRETHHELLTFRSEAEFRSYVKRTTLDDTGIIDFLRGRDAALAEAESELTAEKAELKSQIDRMEAASSGSADELRQLHRQLRSCEQKLEARDNWDDEWVEWDEQQVKSFARSHPNVWNGLQLYDEIGLDSLTRLGDPRTPINELACRPGRVGRGASRRRARSSTSRAPTARSGSSRDCRCFECADEQQQTD